MNIIAQRAFDPKLLILVDALDECGDICLFVIVSDFSKNCHQRSSKLL